MVVVSSTILLYWVAVSEPVSVGQVTGDEGKTSSLGWRNEWFHVWRSGIGLGFDMLNLHLLNLASNVLRK